MKYSKIALVYLTVLVSCFLSCNVVAFNAETIKGNGKMISKVIDCTNVEEISNDGIFDIQVYYGEKIEVTIVTDENILQYLKIRNSGNKIHFFHENNVNLQPTKSIIYITMPLLAKVSNTGTGDFSFSKFANLNKLDISNSGTGDVKAEAISLNELNIVNSGTGDFELKGQSKMINIENTGTGDVNSLDFLAVLAKVSSTGTGDVKLWVEKELELNLTGTGDFTYKGEPIVSKIQATGTGDVKKLTQ
jgi:hypothetical protein